MTPRAVMVGLPGSGKTTTGRRLAKILAVPFRDSDELIEAVAGRTVAEIFDRDGEPAFRELEQQVVLMALTDYHGVFSLGGGALGSATTRTAISRSEVAVVWLRTSLSTLLARIGDARTRPLLSEDPKARLTALAAERDPHYAALATITVDTEGKTPGQVAATIAARLHEREVRV